ncbi:MAG TPA: transcriptional regulator, partial [Nocardioides sp.]
MYDADRRREALELLGSGLTLSETSRRTGVQRSTLRAWRDGAPDPPLCPRCDGGPLPHPAYAALLGFYLGDGCVSLLARTTSLRVSCDAALPGIVADVTRVVEAVHPSRPSFHVRAPGATVVQSYWKHWPCLFPQHGPGRKHERTIALEPWQRAVVEAHPAAFLRGLFHSDGSRVRNWATRRVAGELRRYDDPRWQFVNRSDDVRRLCCWALDLVDVPWRASSTTTISVSRRDAVSRLDTLIG